MPMRHHHHPLNLHPHHHHRHPHHQVHNRKKVKMKRQLLHHQKNKYSLPDRVHTTNTRVILFLQVSTSNKTATGKKGNVNDENNKATNGIKTPTKQQNSARTENTADAAQGADKKKKPAKGNPTPAPTKQPATGKSKQIID